MDALVDLVTGLATGHDGLDDLVREGRLHRPGAPVRPDDPHVHAGRGGVGLMEHRWFVSYNIAGGVAWGTSMTWGGYLPGQAASSIGDRIHIMVGIVILLVLIPIVVELSRERRRRSA